MVERFMPPGNVANAHGPLPLALPSKSLRGTSESRPWARRITRVAALAIRWARIGEAVGHADLVTTARTYTHVLADEKEIDYADLLAARSSSVAQTNRPERLRGARTNPYAAAVARIEERLQELGLALPAPMDPPGNFELVKIHAGIAYVAGHPAIDGSKVLVEGVVGRDLSLDEAYEAARLTALSILASLKRELGDLDRVTDWLRVVGYVQTAPDFGENPKVVNGFSDLIVELWGDAGRHARSAPGQGPSPLNVPIIVDAIVAVDGGQERAGTTPLGAPLGFERPSFF
jgi:YjgF/chorismate_mutase-like, putative endoribonuclease